MKFSNLSYFYDEETGLYYLNSRYYNPQWGRFISADAYASTDTNSILSANTFAYCENNPIVRQDACGEFWNTIIGAVVGAVVGGISAAMAGTSVTAGIVSGAISGAISGAAIDIAIATGGIGLIGIAVVSGIGSAGSSYINQRMNGMTHEEVDWGTVAIDGVWGSIGGAISFGVADIGGAACRTLAQNLALKGTAFWTQVGNDFSSTFAITIGTWFNGTKMGWMKDGKGSIVPLF